MGGKNKKAHRGASRDGSKNIFHKNVKRNREAIEPEKKKQREKRKKRGRKKTRKKTQNRTHKELFWVLSPVLFFLSRMPFAYFVPVRLFGSIAFFFVPLPVGGRKGPGEGGPDGGRFGAAGVPHDSPRTPTAHIRGSRRFKHHQNSTRKPREEWMRIVAGEEKKKTRNFGPSTLQGPTPHDIHQIGQTDWPKLAKSGWPKTDWPKSVRVLTTNDGFTFSVTIYVQQRFG